MNDPLHVIQPSNVLHLLYERPFTRNSRFKYLSYAIKMTFRLYEVNIKATEKGFHLFQWPRLALLFVCDLIFSISQSNTLLSRDEFFFRVYYGFDGFPA